MQWLNQLSLHTIMDTDHKKKQQQNAETQAHKK